MKVRLRGAVTFALMNNRQVMYWVSQITGWGLFVLGNILTAFFLGGDLSQAYLISVFIFITGILTTHFFRYLVHRWDWKNLALSAQIPRVVVSVVAMSLVFTALNTVLVNVWMGERPIHEEFEFTDFIQSVFNFAALFMLWSIIYFAVMTFRNWKKEEIQNLELRAAKTEIELNSFKAQMNPHFMFNSLNSIRALVDENPEKAKHAITMLSGILRNNLMLGKKQTVPLREELDLVNKYLSLEKIRFEERLTIEMEVQPEAFPLEVPAFMLQTIVENSIKHGISKRMEGGRVHIHASVNGETLIVKVINSGTLLNEERADGIGINNTKKRLEILYNGRASFDIKSESGEVHAELRIPVNS